MSTEVNQETEEKKSWNKRQLLWDNGLKEEYSKFPSNPSFQIGITPIDKFKGEA